MRKGWCLLLALLMLLPGCGKTGDGSASLPGSESGAVSAEQPPEPEGESLFPR